MSRTFSVTWDNITLPNAACTVAYLRPSSTQGFELVEARLGFSANATAAQCRVQIVAQPVSGSPSGFTSKTPVPLDRSLTQASALTGGTSMGAGTSGVQAGSSVESGGTRVVLVADAFHHLTGWLWVPTPKNRIILPAGSTEVLALYIPQAAGTLTGWSGSLTFAEST